ncbi:PREDICTED: anthocyanidin [Prunus dulcis]|uniref:Glycosyltransferase n=1 Tax=Prunus dulcis TaxID=3755 RepID=A0A5E4E9P3_PRUDU|nr:anthocyanidin 3-O-glucosyltransferase 2-like [Prunus dulcis]KAI5347333.1 hypothetical protein L3X38_015212 [Prunus dulcis]VVA11461.1 PREDICTED: anthocyanidin [Prunus dulcis]
MAPQPSDDDHVVYEHHVAALAFPFSTHASPTLALVRRLAAASPNTLFSFFSTSQSNNSLFSNTITNLPRNIKVFDVADGVPDGYVFAGKPQEDIELFMKAAPNNFTTSLDACVAHTGKRLTCLITDAFLWFGANLAHDLGVPWLPLWLSGLNSLSLHVHTDLLRHNIGTQSIAGRENELITKNVNIPGMSKVRIKDLPEGVIFGNLDSVFSRMLHQMGQLLPLANAVLVNSFEELDIAVTNDLKSKFNKLLNVGPFNLAAAASPPLPEAPTAADDVTGCLSWLDKQKAASSVVYVSFGSVARPPEKELMAMAQALEASGVPFLWSLKGSFKTPLLNELLIKATNGMVVSWAPQPRVLAHASVGAFVTHCGWSSLLEAIAGRVPMICRPFFGDQRVNARLVEEVLEIGVTVEDGVFTKHGMIKYFDEVLSQQRGKKMRDNINTVKLLAQESVEPKGGSAQNFKLLLDVISGSTKV